MYTHVPRRNSRTITAALFLMTLIAAPPALSDEGKDVADKFATLTQDSRYKLIKSVPLDFNTYHPQGMAVVGDRIYLTSVQVVDRSAGKGIGHLFEFDREGHLLRQMEWADGPRYHPSGMDYDGRYLWIALAEYKRSSTSTVYRIAPETMEAERIFRFDDHLGAIVRHPGLNVLLGVNWGSRTFYRWALGADGLPVAPDKPVVLPNPNHYIDFQDLQWLPGTPYVLLGGVKGYRVPGRNAPALSLGGIDMYDLEKDAAVNQIPINRWSRSGRSVNQNPFYVLDSHKGLQFFFIPDDNPSTMYIYETETTASRP